MLKFTEKILTPSRQGDSCYSTLTLALEQRLRSRLKVTLDNGVEAGLFLPRGTVLQQDDRIKADSGEVIRILAAEESVSTVYIENPLMMARASYHLGNRHVQLQIANGFIRYQHDHVLDDMLRGLGLDVTVEMAPFEPESGAYGEFSSGQGHHHGH